MVAITSNGVKSKTCARMNFSRIIAVTHVKACTFFQTRRQAVPGQVDSTGFDNRAYVLREMCDVNHAIVHLEGMSLICLVHLVFEQSL